MYRAEGRQIAEQQAPQFEAAPDAGRTVTIYRVATLTTASGPILCLVRALSMRAATLDIDLPFTSQEEATLEIGRERFSGSLVKLGDRRAKLHSRTPIDFEAILADPSVVSGGGRRALPRVEVDARARIDLGAHRFAAEIRDISTDGTRIYTDELLSIGDQVRVVLKGMDTPLAGVVRWCGGDYAGIEFHQKLPIGRLNAWLATQAGFDAPGLDAPIISKS